jgi:hypothetical protein
VYELTDSALGVVQRVLHDEGVPSGPHGFDGSVLTCIAIARALRAAANDPDGDSTLTESMRNDLFHFGAFNAVAADHGGYTVTGIVPDMDDSDVFREGESESSADDDDDDGDPFDTWESLRGWAEETYEVEDEGGDIFSFVVDWTDTERTQRVIVRPANIQDEMCAVFVSFVARREQVDPWALLSRNLEDAFATFGIDDEGRVLLTCTFPVAMLTPGRFDALVDVLAARADDAEEEFTSTDEF